MYRIFIIAVLVLPASCSSGIKRQKSLVPEKRTEVITNQSGKGQEITIDFYKGKAFNYPLMAAWLEDEEGKYIQTLYVAKSVATGIFRYGRQENNKWVEAPKRAPQTLPYWAHRRGIVASDGLYMPEPSNPVPDAYTGATPTTGFSVISRADHKLNGTIRVLFEINQNWDWNEYWTNDRYPDDEYYKMSCQPALVYEAKTDAGNTGIAYRMIPIGHSHYSGKTGELFTDLSTLTTALQIADSIIVRIK
jgi:hypothetical protein